MWLVQVSMSDIACSCKGPFNNYVDKMRKGVGQKMSVFVHAQGIKTVHAGGGGKKWQNSVHVVVECHLDMELKVLVVLTPRT